MNRIILKDFQFYILNNALGNKSPRFRLNKASYSGTAEKLE
jgi:hypothetical protein